ncbi:hypothetical protein SSX86_004371 [Deinandra increscens subsp. villosa]|uniref:DNA-directed RNA polymerase III subunit RPC9 n=1 Tax=Deinandra increscens subsp. villosa TaxID=3103831 RepID=A0AAP0DMW0_9ASTR
MKILKENAGMLTNFEVVDFLQSRGAAKDPTEFKVYDYLVHTPACNQTREIIAEFVTKCRPYRLTKSEITNIIGIRPSSNVEIDPIVVNLGSRLGESVEEVVELVVQLLPPPQDQSRPDE